MTAELDVKMDRISEGELRRDAVVAESQEMLEQAWKLLDGHIADIRERIKSGVREDLTLGECTNCGGQLRVLRGKTGKRFAACVGEDGDAPQPAGGRGAVRGAAAVRPSRCRSAARSRRPARRAASAAGQRSRSSAPAVAGRPWVLCVDIDCPSKEKYRARADARKKDA